MSVRPDCNAGCRPSNMPCAFPSSAVRVVSMSNGDPLVVADGDPILDGDRVALDRHYSYGLPQIPTSAGDHYDISPWRTRTSVSVWAAGIQTVQHRLRRLHSMRTPCATQ